MQTRLVIHGRMPLLRARRFATCGVGRSCAALRIVCSGRHRTARVPSDVRRIREAGWGAGVRAAHSCASGFDQMSTEVRAIERMKMANEGKTVVTGPKWYASGRGIFCRDAGFQLA